MPFVSTELSMNFSMGTLSGMPFSEIPPSSGATRPTRLSNKSLKAGDHSGFVTGNLARKDPSSSYRCRSSLHVVSSRTDSRAGGIYSRFIGTAKPTVRFLACLLRALLT